MRKTIEQCPRRASSSARHTEPSPGMLRAAWRLFHGVANGTPMGGSLRVDVLPVLEDNFSFIVTDQTSLVSAIVDPPNFSQVHEYYQRLRDEEKVHELVSILVTHHHSDHCGGVPHFLERYPGIPVYGPEGEAILGRTVGVGDGHEFRIGQLEVQVVGTPGHTQGHVSYFVRPTGAGSPQPAVAVTDAGDGVGAGALFCGDTLFVGGCGRFFEGTASDQFKSFQRLRGLAGSTRVYCGHEYTLKNLQFAGLVDSTNPLLRTKFDLAWGRRERSLPSVPSTIADELATNPFLRTDDPDVARMVSMLASASLARQVDPDDPVDVLGAMRELKDRY
jgi:hydroxyacylglutathione hydrolase